MSRKYAICNTSGFLALVQEATQSDRNRQLDANELNKIIDPAGKHVCSFVMVHNDVEMRTIWLVKRKGTMDFIEVTLDVSFENWNLLQKVEAPT